ncbi:MAG: hypothetical protein KKE36_03930 [Actinobacteria bacterium]|nr:hypothetical protein [Actinomycetota bacterium]
MTAATAVAAGARASRRTGNRSSAEARAGKTAGESEEVLGSVQDDMSEIFAGSSETRDMMLGDLGQLEALAVSKGGGEGGSGSVEVKVLVLDGGDIPAPAGDPRQFELANAVAEKYAAQYLVYYSELSQLRRRSAGDGGDERARECRRLQMRACDYISRSMLEYGRAVDMLRGGTQPGLEGAAHVIEVAEELRLKGRNYMASARRALASLLAGEYP